MIKSKFYERKAERDYLLSEFPLAFALLMETSAALHGAFTKDHSTRNGIIHQALDAAAEYGKLHCLVRLLHIDPDKLLASFIADDEECDPDEDDSDSRNDC